MQQELGSRRRLTVAFALLAAPFYLNDFANMLVRDWRLWLTIDYVFLKLLPLVAILWLVRSRRMRAEDFGWKLLPWKTFIPAFLVLALAGMLFDQNGYMMLKKVPGYAALGGMPAIESPAWNWIDLTVGLALVGLMEELIFRGLAAACLEHYLPPAGVVAVSALLFGLIHWSLGWHSVVVTGAIGAVFMFAYLRLRSILPLVLAHFVVNFIDFAGVIPKGQLQFL
jgi:membrane protease YdiL (CAAX protease family)